MIVSYHSTNETRGSLAKRLAEARKEMVHWKEVLITTETKVFAHQGFNTVESNIFVEAMNTFKKMGILPKGMAFVKNYGEIYFN